MIEFERRSVSTNILLVYGAELFTGFDYRNNLRDYLNSAPLDCPVRKGTHDFWVTYYVISGRDPSDNFAFEDMSVTPRPMRGIVEMENVPRDISDGTIRHQVSTLLQEAGHHWLVPRDLLIKNDAFWPSTSFRPYQMPGREETSLSLEEGSPYYGPPLLGRDNLHWSRLLSVRSICL